jgi:hypothetical protein
VSRRRRESNADPAKRHFRSLELPGALGATQHGVVGEQRDHLMLTMPPQPLEYQGHGAIAALLAPPGRAARRADACRAHPANIQPAFGCYLRDAHAAIVRPYGLIVLTLAITAITWFADRRLPPLRASTDGRLKITAPRRAHRPAKIGVDFRGLARSSVLEPRSSSALPRMHARCLHAAQAHTRLERSELHGNPRHAAGGQLVSPRDLRNLVGRRRRRARTPRSEDRAAGGSRS